MIEVEGLHNKALCFTEHLDEVSKAQIKLVCDQEVFSDCKIRIMPDVHAGKGCTIGTTMTIKDKVVPGMVGVDIGCGMETIELGNKEIDLAKLDAAIHSLIPSGQEIREIVHPLSNKIDLEKLSCANKVNIERAKKSIGSLGGGNHFIEVDKDEDNNLFLVIHSGSRHLGNEVAFFYQEEGRKALWGGANYQIQEMILKLKKEGRFQEIQPMIKQLQQVHQLSLPESLAYVKGKLFADYLHDMQLIQQFAVLNRKAMAEVIISALHLEVKEEFTTIHNYIDLDKMILRKGSVSALKGEKLLIPINMRDGSLICLGKGNPEWNYSAPHGAGRLMSRKQAFGKLSMTEYEKEMSGIYSSCVLPETLDESPMAYKSEEEITTQIVETVDIIKKIKPIYNFKASE